MKEQIGIRYLQSQEKADFEAHAWKMLEIPARTLVAAEALAICVADRTVDWRYNDIREVRGRQPINWSKPRTIARPQTEQEAAVALLTCGKAHPLATKLGDFLRSHGLDELDGYVNAPRDRADPAHMDFCSGYRAERPDDVERTLALLSSKAGRQLLEGRSVANIGLTGPPMLLSYKQIDSHSDKSLTARAHREIDFYWNRPVDGGSCRSLDRKICLTTIPTILLARRTHTQARAHNILRATALVAGVEAASASIIENALSLV